MIKLYEFYPFKKTGQFCICTACLEIRDNGIANHRPTPTILEPRGTQCAKCWGWIPSIAYKMIEEYTRWDEMDPKYL